MKKFLRTLWTVLAFSLVLPLLADGSSLSALIPALSSVTVFAQQQDGSSAAEDSGGVPEGDVVTVDPSREGVLLEEDQQLEDFQEPEYTPQFTMPEELRAVDLTPGANFAADENATDEQIVAECKNLLTDMLDWGMNAVILDTSYKGKAYYTTDINDTVITTPVELAVQTAKEMGFFVYLVFDLNFELSRILSESSMTLQQRIDYLALSAHSFTLKYKTDGIILSGYYSSRNSSTFDDYMLNGSGIGFDNWLMDNGAYVFSLVSDAIRRTDNTVPVGIYLKDVWANASSNEGGSNTADSFQALTDGYADTLSYVRRGFADFMLVSAEGSLTDNALPFEEVISWWDNVAKEMDLPLFVMHHNDRICTSAAGWSSPDQLVHQLRRAKELDAYKGSAFLSYSTLKANPGSSTSNALVKYYNDTLNMETIDNELTIVSPQQTEFTTSNSSVAFQGTFDSNFEVYFNGEIITLNEAGNFYYEEELDVGLNVFTIENKGKTITYRITRKVTVLKSAEPTGEMAVEGGTNIAISAVAYKGSAVSASVNGKNVNLTAQEDGYIEGEENSDYVRYTGVYVVPKGIIGKTQDLGNIVIYGRYTGKNGASFDMSITGAHVIINALPEVPNNADGNLLRVNNDNTVVYNYHTTDAVATPNQARLPAGTMDYIVKKVTYSGTSYYLTLSGKRLKASDCTVLENEPLGSNTINASSASLSGNDTVLRLDLGVKSPYSITYTGVNYAGGDNYSVGGFAATAINITFDYANGGAGGFSMPSGGVFSGGSWGNVSESNGVSRVTLTLSLARTGVFHGLSASYEGNTLVLRFNGAERSLSGMTIVIDPGHGVTSTGALDPGGVGHVTDQQVGLWIAKQLESQLSSAGANVIRLKTESQYIDTFQRSSYARQYKPDLYISIHGNKATNASGVRGVEAYYFMPFSQPLAACVSASVASYYQNSVYKDGVNRNRGAKYDYFAVTLQQEFPSILLEVGFVSNYEEAMAMANSAHQAGIAGAIMQGIQNFISR